MIFLVVLGDFQMQKHTKVYGIKMVQSKSIWICLGGYGTLRIALVLASGGNQVAMELGFKWQRTSMRRKHTQVRRH